MEEHDSVERESLRTLIQHWETGTVPNHILYSRVTGLRCGNDTLRPNRKNGGMVGRSRWKKKNVGIPVYPTCNRKADSLQITWCDPVFLPFGYVLEREDKVEAVAVRKDHDNPLHVQFYQGESGSRTYSTLRNGNAQRITRRLDRIADLINDVRSH